MDGVDVDEGDSGGVVDQDVAFLEVADDGVDAVDGFHREAEVGGDVGEVLPGGVGGPLGCRGQWVVAVGGLDRAWISTALVVSMRDMR
ncbi:hypothetical protein MFAL_13880 [Mycolicibacterium fallax]|nr:hypothetical protein MFAL_13880 [Mycolicibacterium fallax]